MADQEVEASGLLKEETGFDCGLSGANSCAAVGAPELYGAQIFRFGLGCHVGSEILCGRLLPPPIHGVRGALGWCLKRRLSFLQRAKLLKGVSVRLTAAWSVQDA